ncbi:MAG TPA: HNH endonuclease [Sphingomicrobium sp.]|nr:HNH endonuclease [Sphingomicrobium sp.]
MKSWRSPSRRAKLHEAQNGRCPTCGYRIRNVARATLDHVRPRRYGARNANNLLLLHERCNYAKGSRMPNGCELLWLDIVNVRMSNAR